MLCLVVLCCVAGLYELVPGVVYNNRPLYRKVAYPDRWLLFDSCSHWNVCSTHAMRGNIRDGFCESVLLPLGDDDDDDDASSDDECGVDRAEHSDLLPTTIAR